MDRFLSHFRSVGWVYIVVGALVLWARVLSHLNEMPPIDLETVREASAYQEARLAEFSGPPRYAELEALWSKDDRDEDFIRDERMKRLADFLWRSAGEPWVTELDEIEEEFGDRLDAWDGLNGLATYLIPYEELIALHDDEDSTPYYRAIQEVLNPRYRFLEYRSQFRLAQAVRALKQQDWEEALDKIELAISTWMPVHATGPRISGFLAQLETARKGYTELLRAEEAPAQVLGEARIRLEAFIQDGRSFPTFAIHPMAASLSMAHPAQSPGIFGWNFTPATPAVMSALRYQDRFTYQALLNWADHFPKPSDYMKSPWWTFMSWTLRPAETKALKLIAENEPQVFASHQLPEEMIQRLDPWTLVSTLSYDYSDGEAFDSQRRTNLLTELRMIELGFAAKRYRLDHDEWPESLDDLHPNYLNLPLEGTQVEAPPMVLKPGERFWTKDRPGGAFDSPSDVMLPIRMGVLSKNRDFAEDFVTRFAPRKRWEGYANSREIRRRDLPNGDLELQWDVQETKLLKSFADLSRLRSFRSLVRKAQLEQKSESNREAWIAVDPEIYREISHRFSSPGSSRMDYRIRLILRDPGPMFAIWWYGFDGRDDSASFPCIRPDLHDHAPDDMKRLIYDSSIYLEAL